MSKKITKGKNSSYNLKNISNNESYPKNLPLLSFDRSEMKYVIFIVLFGFLIRITCVLELSSTPFFSNLFSDSKIYHDWAVKIASGEWVGKDVFFMSPAYPYFLAIIYSIFGQSFLLVGIIQVLFSSINIFIIYLIGRNFHSSKVGYISALITAVYGPLIFYSALILSETLQVFFVSILILLLSKFNFEINKKWAFLTGMLIGIAAIFRANILIFFPGVILWLLYSQKVHKESKTKFTKTIITFSLGLIIIIMPVTIRNLVVANDLIIITSNGGINFYLGNNPKSEGIFIAPIEFDYYNDLSGKNYAEYVLTKKLKSSEVSNYWFNRGMDYIIEEPLEALTLFARKFYLFIGSSENAQSSMMDIDFVGKEYSTILKMPFISFFILSLLAFPAFFILWAKRKYYSLYLIFILCYTLGTISFFVNGRYRLALIPLLIVFSGYTINFFIVNISKKKLKLLLNPLIVICLIVLINIIFVPKYNFSEYDVYLNQGNFHFNQKEYSKAIELYKKSLMLRNYYITNVNLGNALSLAGDLKSAEIAYNRAITQNPRYFLAYFNLGLLNVQRSNWINALNNFEHTTKLDSTFADAYRNTGIIYYINRDYPKAIENFEKYLVYSRDEDTKSSIRSDIRDIQSRIYVNKSIK
ncbi:MAG: glycosyltransferase family 39 protein [Bacteroidetes bacterium]|nr:glycosyltransferase family 39 protein [Bacteroidota bacterium]MBU2586223.1 glycosyltransferase family 39 protein [Bacteroidota bacterium]